MNAPGYDKEQTRANLRAQLASKTTEHPFQQKPVKVKRAAKSLTRKHGLGRKEFGIVIRAAEDLLLRVFADDNANFDCHLASSYDCRFVHA